MRQLAGYVAAIGITVVGLGLLIPHDRRATRVLAEGKPAAAEPDALVKIVDPFRTTAVQEVTHASDPLPRPRKVEDEGFRRGPTLDAADFQAERGLGHDLEVGVVLRSPKPRSAPRALLSEDAPAFDPSPRVAVPRNAPVPRVTLELTADHQVHIVVAGRADSTVKSTPGTAAILITAEEFRLIPSTEPGVGNQIICQGNVVIHSPQFRASGNQLSLNKGILVLEGTAEHPAVVTKAAAGANAATPAVPSVPAVPDPNFGAVEEFIPPRRTPGTVPNYPDPPRVVQAVPQVPTNPPAPEFHVSATRITFTLAFDRLQLGNGTVITPTSPATSATPDSGPKPGATRDSPEPPASPIPPGVIKRIPKPNVPAEVKTPPVEPQPEAPPVPEDQP